MSEFRAEYKSCSKCEKLKPLSEFNFRHRAKSTRHSYCRECGSAFTRSHYERNKRSYLDRNAQVYRSHRDIVRQAKAKPCADCGLSYPFYVMDFDHKDGASKSFELNSVHRRTIAAILREIEKCDVVCANCHRERTYRRLMQPRQTPPL